MADKSISQLVQANSTEGTDLLEVAQVNSGSASGYVTRSESIDQISEYVGTRASFSDLETDDKNLVDAVNEVKNNSLQWIQGNILASKNLVPFITQDKSGKVSNGATFEILEDGTVKVNRTVTTGTAVFYMSSRTEDGNLFLPNGRYFLSGCPEGGSTSGSSGYQMSISATINGGNYAYGYDGGDGFEFDVSGDDYSNDGAFCRISIILRAGVSASNMIFKPLLMLASIKDKSYVPPQNTNNYLTQNKIECKNLANSEMTDSASKSYSVGDYMILRGLLYKVTAPISAGGAITIDTNITLTTIETELKALFDALS